MSRDSPCQCTLISVLRSGWFDSCDTTLHGICPLMPANFSRVPVSVRACGPASVSPLPSFCPSKRLGTSRENAIGLPEKKGKKTDAWAAQARKEVAPQPRGHLTTRRQMPIGRGMCPHHTSCSNSSACTPFLLLTYRSTIAELRSRKLSGGRERSALVSAR